MRVCILFFFFNDTATTEIYTLSLTRRSSDLQAAPRQDVQELGEREVVAPLALPAPPTNGANISHSPPPIPCTHRGSSSGADRKSTRLNSSHANISYAVFCLKKNTKNRISLHH